MDPLGGRDPVAPALLLATWDRGQGTVTFLRDDGMQATFPAPTPRAPSDRIQRLRWRPLELAAVAGAKISDRARQGADRGVGRDGEHEDGEGWFESTGAGAVMVAVFFTFALSGPIPPKEMGVVLGIAVLLDAFLVRLVLLPVLLRLTGKAAWHTPTWLGKILPNITFAHD